MLGKETVSDRVISQKVTQALANHGLRAPCEIRVSARGGNVTLAGTIEFDHQRKNAVRSALGVAGVRRVVDQLHIKAHRGWAQESK